MKLEKGRRLTYNQRPFCIKVKFIFTVQKVRNQFLNWEAVRVRVLARTRLRPTK